MDDGSNKFRRYNTIYNITEKNNKIKFLGTERDLKEYKTGPEFMSKEKHLYDTINIEEIIRETIRKLINAFNFEETNRLISAQRCT